MVDLWRCEICGDPYVGEAPPANCPFCGAHTNFVKPYSEAKVTFDIELTEKDRANAEKALKLEVSNTAFYRCASEKSNDEEARALFHALMKVEHEHASIWRKILKLDKLPEADDPCSEDNIANIKESHEREVMAIEFYHKASLESDSPVLKKLFAALVVIETDHKRLDEIYLERLS